MIWYARFNLSSKIFNPKTGFVTPKGHFVTPKGGFVMVGQEQGNCWFIFDFDKKLDKIKVLEI
jgi:hypothetical protein